MTNGSEDPSGEAVPLREIFGEGGIPTDVMPNFAVVIRGYERNQVDGYVAELLTALEETRSRLEDAENRLTALSDQAGDLAATVTRHQALPAFADLGDHISAMMATAAEESDTMRRRAEAEAIETVNRAQEQGHAMLRAADERATDVRAKAERLQVEAQAAKQRALEDATREAAALVADGERRRRETLAAAEALMAAATEEVTRIRATRDLGVEALEELSAVLTRVAAESREAWQKQDGASAVRPEPAAENGGRAAASPAAGTGSGGPSTAEGAEDPGGPEPGDDTVKLIDLDAEPVDETPSSNRRAR